MAFNAFIQFKGPDINGGCTVAKQEGKSQITSLSHGCAQPTSPVRSHAGGGTIEKANHGDLTFTKELDSATDDLLKQCWTGKHIDVAIVTLFRSTGDADDVSGTEFLRIEMDSVIVSSYSISASESQFPHEVISLAYGKVTYTYTGHDRSKGTTGSAQPVYHDLRDHTIG